MSTLERRRSPSPSGIPSPSRDGFLFKGQGPEESEHLIASPSARSRPAALGLSPRPASAAAECQDYSKINQNRYTARKMDTFNTPSGLNDKNFDTAVRVSKRDLYEICEQSFRTVSKDISRDVKMDVQQSLALVQQELVGEKIAKEARDSEVSTTMMHMHQILSQRPSDLDIVQKDIKSGEILMLEGYRDLMLRLEGKLLQSIDQVSSEVRSEVQDLRRAQHEAQEALMTQLRELIENEHKVAAAEHVRNAEQQAVDSRALSSVADMQESLNTCCLQNGKEIQKVREEQLKQQESIRAALEDQLVKHMSGSVFKVDNAKVISQIQALSMLSHRDFAHLWQEIARIQRALNIDFADVVEEIGVQSLSGNAGSSNVHLMGIELAELDVDSDQQREVAEPRRAPKRLREYWTQTDQKGTAEAWMQTDVPKKIKKPAKVEPADIMALGFGPIGSLQIAVEKARETKPMFADVEAMKVKVRQALLRPQYNIADYYHYKGCSQAIAKSSWFEYTTLLVIFLNAIWIAVDIDNNSEEVLFNAQPVFIVAENSFCGYFFLELAIRFLAFRKTEYCLRDFWFTFDFVLVILMVTETWIVTAVMYFQMAATDDASGTGVGSASILRILRVAKMVRVTRMARILRTIPELVILIKGIGAAGRSVLVFFNLWLIIIYVFAVVFRQLTAGDPIGSQYFPSVPAAMNTLLLDGIFPDTSAFVNNLADANPVLWPIIIAFILLAAMTLMYMLIGVLVDVVGAIAKTEKECTSVISMASQLRSAWEVMDRDASEPITKEDFQTLLLEPELVHVAQDVGVDVIMLVESADAVFEDYEKGGKQMNFGDFVELMLKMRGGNLATVKDITEHLKVTRTTVQNCMEDLLIKVGDEFSDLRKELNNQAKLFRPRSPDDSDDESVMIGAGTSTLNVPGFRK